MYKEGYIPLGGLLGRLGRLTIIGIILTVLFLSGLTVTWQDNHPSVYLKSTPIIAATENWTDGWTEVDPNSKLTVAANNITVTNMDRDAACWVYKDFGAGYWGTTISDITFAADFSTVGSETDLYIFALANVNNPVQTTDPIFSVKFVLETTVRVRIEVDDGATQQEDVTAGGLLSANTTYYFTFSRDASGCVIKIYDDVARGAGDLLDTLTVNRGTTTFQYVALAFPRGSGGNSNYSNGHIYDLDLGIEAPAEGAPTVITNVASDVEDTSANLSGNVTDIGTANVTYWGVQIGTSTGNYTDNQSSSGNESASFGFSFLFGDLTEDTTYYFRAFAENENGITFGIERSFETSISDPNALHISTSTANITSTIKSIGITFPYIGDDNEDATVALQYTTDNVTWITAHEMYRDTSRLEFMGSIVCVSENTTYWIKLTFTDADGVEGTNPYTTSTTTRPESYPIGTDYIYVATTGNDTTGDGTIGNPYLTIGKAATVATAGDTVLVRNGTYTLTTAISPSNSGNSTDYITYMPYTGENVTIQGNGSIDELFDISSKDYIIIKGFTFANSVSLGDASATIKLTTSDYCIIEDNFFDDCYAFGIVMLREGASYNIIRNNNFEFATQNATSPENISGIYWWRGGSGNIIYSNNMTALNPWTLWDGMGGGPEDTPIYMLDTDIYDNTITYSSTYTSGVWDRDDGIQLEGGGVNCRIWDNRIENCYVGFGLAPVDIGPYYLFRNVVYNMFGEALKLGDESYGRIYFYHNTFYTSQVGADGFKQTNAYMGNYVAKNNIVYSSRYIYEMGEPQIPHIFDYDFIYTTDGTRFAQIGTTYYTFVALQGGGYELHGISQSEVGFTDNSTGDLTLTAASVCTNNGTVLIGFNDADSAYPYSGDAPDIGYAEYDEGEPVIITPTLTTLSATSVGTDNATLNARVDSTGGETPDCWFYWDTTDHGQVAADWTNNVSMSSQATTFFSLVGSLSENTTYYFIVSGNNSAGWGWGATANFTTLGPYTAPSIELIAASSITSTTARISANVTDAGGTSGSVTFFWGESDGETTPANWTNNSTPDSPAQPQSEGVCYVDLSGLSPATLYYFSARIVTVNGTGWPVASLSFLALPAAPGNVSATDGSSSVNVTITWDACAGNVTGYYVRRDATLIHTANNVTLSFVDTGAAAPVITAGTTSASDGSSNTTITVSLSGQSIAAGTTHTYTVEAYNDTGSGATGSDTGYRGAGALSLQLQRSAADSDAAYSNVAGATSSPHNDVLGVAGTGRYYRWMLTSSGAVTVYSAVNRGYTASNPAPASTEDVGTTIIKTVLTAVIAVIALLVVITTIGTPIVWIPAILMAIVAIVLINSAL